MTSLHDTVASRAEAEQAAGAGCDLPEATAADADALPTGAGDEPGRHLRADAQRNLEAILVAARSVFARRGLDATLDDVAREAGVGVGTVYRRFRDKAELAQAVFERDLGLLVADAERASAIPDPWEGFVEFVRRFLERQAMDCGLRDFVSSAALDDEAVEVMKQRLQPLVEQLVVRAQAAGALRADFDPYDIPVIGVMLGAAADFTRTCRPDVWQRYLALILDAVAGPAAPDRADLPLPAAALARRELDCAMKSWRPRHS